MKAIWKFPLQLVDIQDVVMPKGAEILTVQVQKDDLCMWAAVDPREDTIANTIFIHGTGHQIEDFEKKKYISTFQIAEGDLIFHVFELLK